VRDGERGRDRLQEKMPRACRAIPGLGWRKGDEAAWVDGRDQRCGLEAGENSVRENRGRRELAASAEPHAEAWAQARRMHWSSRRCIDAADHECNEQRACADHDAGGLGPQGVRNRTLTCVQFACETLPTMGSRRTTKPQSTGSQSGSPSVHGNGSNQVAPPSIVKRSQVWSG